MRPGGAQRIPRVRSKTIILGGLPELATEVVQSSKRIPVFRVLMQWTFCIAVAVLGFRVANEADLISNQFRRLGMEEVYGPYIQSFKQTDHTGNGIAILLQNTTITPGSRVDVGRHKILIRPWPHPDPMEMAQAYNLIARVQVEQQRLYGVKSWKPIIAITPMYVRTFQSVHLTGLLHTLSHVPGPVTWIVVEAERATAETAALLRQARVHKLVHLGASEHFPRSLHDRRILESHLRIEGLRQVREQNLEGVVVFADDSNVYNMRFFDMVQKVQWVGALPVGILGHAGFEEPDLSRTGFLSKQSVYKNILASGMSELQVQGPACDSSGNIEGWHAAGSLSLDGELVKRDTDAETKLEWSGFVLNARAVWASEPDRPQWIKEWREWANPEEGQFIDFRSIVSDEAKVEALGSCGSGEEAVLVWWARMEARSDSKYPSRWTLNSPLEVIVKAKKTPWPDRIFPLSSPPPPAGQIPKRKGGNRTGVRTRRGRRRPDLVKTRALDNQRESIKGMPT